MNYLGIDPGLSGALALLGQSKSLLSPFLDMPIQPRGKGGNQVNAAALYDWLVSIKSNGKVQAYVERVGAMPGQGVSSMWHFGEGCGVIRACLACARIPVTYVAPQTWKKTVGLGGAKKEYALTVAAQMFPEAASSLARKKDIGRADAILIAYHGMIRGEVT